MIHHIAWLNNSSILARLLQHLKHSEGL